MDLNLFGDLISSINDYDKSGPFSIGFKMFLFGFALAFECVLLIYEIRLQPRRGAGQKRVYMVKETEFLSST